MKNLRKIFILITVIFIGLVTQANKVFASDAITLTFHEQKDGERLIGLDANGNFGAKVYPGKVVITHIETVSSPNYTFHGWSYFVDDEEKILRIGDTFEADTDFYANWTLTVRTVRYNLNGGANHKDNPRFFYGTDQISLEDPTLEDKVFLGWYDNASLEGSPITNLGNGMRSLTLHAKWADAYYTVTYDADGGFPLPNSEPVFYNSSLETLPVVTKEGHEFLGWYLNDELFDIETKITEDITLVAKWNINTYTITFDSNGGSVIDPITQDYGTEVIAPADPTRAGYTFLGWDLEVPAVMPAEDITLTAQWEAEEYTVTFNPGSGGSVEPSSKKVIHGKTYGLLPTPTRTGYSFDGWATSLLGSIYGHIMVDENTVVTITADQTLYAIWSINKYTITFNSNGGSAVDSITQNYGTAITAPANPTRIGYTFDGWDPSLPATMPAENLTLTARWSINTYTITFNSNGGSAVSSITQNYGTAITAPANPTRTGYTFGGWDPSLPATMPAENLTLTAKWEANQYTVTFDLNGGDSVSPVSKTVTYDEVYGTLPIPMRLGYRFTGWSTSSGSWGGTIVDETTMMNRTSNHTLYARWQRSSTLTVSFSLNYSGSGSNPANKTVTYNAPYGTLPEPTRIGYQFDGWYTRSQGGSKVEETTIVSTQSNHTIYARWIALTSVRITYNAGGGTAAERSKTVYLSQEYGTLSTATRNGYIFLGWFTQASGGVEVTASTIVTNPNAHTLYAQWEQSQISTVTFDANGGRRVRPATKQVTFGQAYGALATVSRSNYTFLGWYTATSGGVLITESTIVSIQGNHTLYARWQRGGGRQMMATIENEIKNNVLIKDDYNIMRIDEKSLENTTNNIPETTLKLIANSNKVEPVKYNEDIKNRYNELMTIKSLDYDQTDEPLSYRLNRLND